MAFMVDMALQTAALLCRERQGTTRDSGNSNMRFFAQKQYPEAYTFKLSPSVLLYLTVPVRLWNAPVTPAL